MPRTLRILVTDDCRDGADALGAVLREDGYRVFVAHSGTEAIAAAHEFLPDVVILDLIMPGTDGFQTAREMRRLTSSHARVIYIAYSGLHSSDVLAQCETEGFQHFLRKPARRHSGRTTGSSS